MHMQEFGWSGWASIQDGNWRTSGGPGSEPGSQEFYNDNQDIWASDLRSLAQRYAGQGWMISAVRCRTWSRKKKHSERHLVRVRNLFTDTYKDNPSVWPAGTMLNAGNLAPGQYIWTSKNSVRSKETTHPFYNPISLDVLTHSPLYISIQGDPNSRREYGYAQVIGLDIWRSRPGFPGSVESVLVNNGKAKPGNASQLAVGNWLSSFRGGQEWLP